MSIEYFTAQQQLRRKAESQLERTPLDPAPTLVPYEGLLHDLRVHQVELEMQNEELRSAQVELTRMRDRYVDLYEFAPTAYLTLNAYGEITNINQTGASLLVVNRGQLRRTTFEQFVMAEDQVMWRKFWGLPRVQGQQQTCDLRMRRWDGTIFFGSLCASLVSSQDGERELRVALTDISEKKLTAQARRKLEARLANLTKRETEVLVLALTGMINKDISAHLRISQRAVENYRSRIHVKTESVSLLELSHQMATVGITLEEISHS